MIALPAAALFARATDFGVSDLFGEENFPLRKNSAGINAAVTLLINVKNVAINDLYGLIYPVKGEIFRDDDNGCLISGIR